MRYRVNYGQGQVGETVRTRKEAKVALEFAQTDTARAFVQQYVPGTADEPGDWFQVRL